MGCDDRGFIAGLILASLIWTPSMIFMCRKDRENWQQKCVEHGAAQYNAKTGEFEWKKSAVPNNSSETTP